MNMLTKTYKRCTLFTTIIIGNFWPHDPPFRIELVVLTINHPVGGVITIPFSRTCAND